MNVNLFNKEPFQMELSKGCQKSNHTGLYWWGLNPVTSVLLRDTRVRRLREVFLMEEETGGVQSLAKEHWSHQKEPSNL